MQKATAFAGVLGLLFVAALGDAAYVARVNHDLARKVAEGDERAEYLARLFPRVDDPTPTPTGAERKPLRAPPFGLAGADERDEVALAGYRGGPVALIALPAGVDQVTGRWMQTLARELPARGVNLIGVTAEAPRRALELLKAHELRFPVGTWAPPGLLYRLAAEKTPRVVPVDKCGRALEPFEAGTVPSPEAVLERFAARYEELGPPERRLARLVPAFKRAARLAPATVERRARGWYRVLDDGGILLGFAKYLERELRCDSCRDLKVLVAVSPEGRIARVEALEPLVVGKATAPAAPSALLKVQAVGRHDHVRPSPTTAAPVEDRSLADQPIASAAVGEALPELEREWPLLDREVRR